MRSVTLCSSSFPTVAHFFSSSPAFFLFPSVWFDAEKGKFYPLQAVERTPPYTLHAVIETSQVQTLLDSPLFS